PSFGASIARALPFTRATGTMTTFTFAATNGPPEAWIEAVGVGPWLDEGLPIEAGGVPARDDGAADGGVVEEAATRQARTKADIAGPARRDRAVGRRSTGAAYERTRIGRC